MCVVFLDFTSRTHYIDRLILRDDRKMIAQRLGGHSENR